MKSFFVSYNQADRAWAEWIAWQLEAAHYTTVLQAWDFQPGSNFIVEMQRATVEASHDRFFGRQRLLDERLERLGRQQMRAPLQGESGWTADRVSTYQPTRPGDGVAGIVLRFRNAVGLIEIRGSGQYAGRATRDSTRVLMNTMLQTFQRAATGADAATG